MEWHWIYQPNSRAGSMIQRHNQHNWLHEFYLFVCLFNGREKWNEVGWVRMSRPSRRGWKTGKDMITMCHMKVSKNENKLTLYYEILTMILFCPLLFFILCVLCVCAVCVFCVWVYLCVWTHACIYSFACVWVHVCGDKKLNTNISLSWSPLG